MKFCVNDNEADVRNRRTTSAKSLNHNERKDKQPKFVLFHASTADKPAMPTTSYKRQVSAVVGKEHDSPIIAEISQNSDDSIAKAGDVNGNRFRQRLVSQNSNVSVSIRSLPKSTDNSVFKKSSISIRRSSRDARSRSESVSSDSTESSRRSISQTYVPAVAWSAFDEHVKNINDSTDYYTKQQKVSFRSSDTFQKTMLGLYGKSEYNKIVPVSKFRAKLGSLAALTNRFAKACNNKPTENGDSEDLSESDYETPDKRTIENAQRGWRVLRRHINERIAKKKGSAASLNWSMLQQTMRGLSDMEKARIDLYKRYGIIPTVNSDGTVVQENTMLSERARAQALLIASTNGSAPTPVIRPRRAQSHKPPSWSQRYGHASTHKISLKHRRPKSSINP